MSVSLKFALLCIVFAVLFATTFVGAENSFIVFQFRLPKLLCASLGGGALALSGLTMQSVFKNPLSGPFVLGVSSGASLGVAIVSLLGIGSTTLLGCIGILPAASLGAFTAIFAVFSCSRFIKNDAGLLIVGLMIGYIADAIVSILIFMSEGKALQGFMAWGMGSFSRLNFYQIPVFVSAIILGIFPLLLSIRYLNLAPLGESFAEGHGVNCKFYRKVTLLASSFLAAVVTAFCGPVAFLGLAVPHLAYGVFKTTNHRVLMPASMLIGAIFSVASTLMQHVPLQAFMSIIGAPVVLWVLLYRGRHAHS